MRAVARACATYWYWQAYHLARCAAQCVWRGKSRYYTVDNIVKEVAERAPTFAPSRRRLLDYVALVRLGKGAKSGARSAVLIVAGTTHEAHRIMELVTQTVVDAASTVDVRGRRAPKACWAQPRVPDGLGDAYVSG